MTNTQKNQPRRSDTIDKIRKRWLWSEQWLRYWESTPRLWRRFSSSWCWRTRYLSRIGCVCRFSAAFLLQRLCHRRFRLRLMRFASLLEHMNLACFIFLYFNFFWSEAHFHFVLNIPVSFFVGSMSDCRYRTILFLWRAYKIMYSTIYFVCQKKIISNIFFSFYLEGICLPC